MTLVQTTSAGTAATATLLAANWGSNTTAGNTVIVTAVNRSGTANDITGVTDTQGNTYTKIQDVNRASIDLSLWYATNITGGTIPLITVSWTTLSSGAFIAREYSGLITTSLDKNAGTTGATATANSGATATTTQNDELVIGAGAGADVTTVWSAGATFGNSVDANATNAGTKSSAHMEDLTVASTGAQTATFGLGASVAWACIVATFKIASTPVAASGSTLMMMGV